MLFVFSCIQLNVYYVHCTFWNEVKEMGCVTLVDDERKIRKEVIKYVDVNNDCHG